jgi:TM2 domain-containing membrane protein YozV
VRGNGIRTTLFAIVDIQLLLFILLTRTDSGGWTFYIWRLADIFGSQFISNARRLAGQSDDTGIANSS